MCRHRATQDVISNEQDHSSCVQVDYEVPQLRRNTAMAAVLHGLQRTFAVEWPEGGALRQLGMGALNAAPAARAQLMRAAMGGA
jgi:2-polyprenyl-6-methoxyphenol hydroxylase-like FAD-dependent oxidoreductase